MIPKRGTKFEEKLIFCFENEFCLMALNVDATFEGKLTSAFKNYMRNLANVHQSMLESLKIGNRENN